MNGVRFSLRKIMVNAVSIGGGEVANKASSFLVYAAVSRIAGLEAFGQLALGLTLLYTCHVFGYAGLPTVLIRSVARRPRLAKRYLFQGYLAASISSMLAALAMAAVALTLRYQATTTQVICVLALAVPFWSLSMITEAIIKGRDQMHLIAVGNLPGNVLMVLGSLTVLLLGYGVMGVALIVVLARLMTLLTLHFLTTFALLSDRPSRDHLRLSQSLRLLWYSRLFLGTDGITAIGASLFGVLLSKFTSESEVGILNAAFQLLQPIQIMYRSVGHSIFPPLVNAAKASKQAVANLANLVSGLLMRLAFPACLVMLVFAGDLLDLVYGNKGFRQGELVLQIVSFSLLFDPLNPVLGHGLWAIGADRAVFRIVLTNIIVGLVLGLILIGNFGLIGAAVSALVTSIVNTIQHYVMFTRQIASPGLLAVSVRLAPAILLSLAVVALSPWSRFISLPLAISLYGLIVLAMTPAAVGLLNPLKKESPS